MVYDSVLVLVDANELGEEVVDTQFVVVRVSKGSGEVGKGGLGLNINNLDLLLEEIALVKEENHGGVGEVAVVANLLEKADGFLHPVGCGILEENLVVLRQGGDEDDSGDIVEAVDPLLPLISLSPNIVHLEGCSVDNVFLSDNS